MMRYRKNIATFSLVFMFAAHLNTSAVIAQQVANNAVTVDAEIARIEAETMQNLDIQAGKGDLADVQKRADAAADGASGINDCRSLALMTPECRGDEPCQNQIWEKLKSCVSRFPMATLNGSLTDWLSDRLRLARLAIERSDRTVAKYESETAKAEALTAKANAESAEIIAEHEKIRLEETSLANQASVDEIEKIREELAAKEASLPANPKP